MSGSVLLAILAVIAVAIVIAAIYLRLKPGTVFGTAGFGPWPGTLARNRSDLPPGIVLGRSESGDLAGWSDEGHWLLFARTGAGKSTGVLMPSIKQWQGNLLAVDIKGELAESCADALRSANINCLRIDPFKVLDGNEKVREIGIDPVAQAAQAADPAAAFRKLAGLIIDPPGPQDAHWTESAQMVVAGLIAAASEAKAPENKGLRGVAYLVDKGYSVIKLLEKQPWSEQVEPLVLRVVRMLADASANERGAILSTVRRQLDFLASENVRASLTGDWEPNELVGSGATALFVILPANRLASHARLLRIVAGSVTEALLEAGPDRERQLLLVIDEASALGKMEAIEQGIGLFRGYGATFMLSFQDEQQLESAYGQATAGSIKANCHAAYWACNDQQTCESVSHMLGQHTAIAKSSEVAKIPLGSAGETSEHEVGRPLLTPDEIRRLPSDAMICFNPGHRPSKLHLLKPNEWQ